MDSKFSITIIYWYREGAGDGALTMLAEAGTWRRKINEIVHDDFL